MPGFDGIRDPPNPELGGSDGHFVPTPADLEKVERSSGETRVAAL